MKWLQFNQKQKHLLLLSGFILLIYFPVFLHLDTKPLREWDEARNAINAYEMTEHHNLLVKTYNHEPDLWETKPPLLIWLQAAGFRSTPPVVRPARWAAMRVKPKPLPTSRMLRTPPPAPADIRAIKVAPFSSRYATSLAYAS